jgi:hypothetical protein
LRIRFSVPALFLILAFVFAGTPAAAQSVASVVDNMKARYDKQIETVDTYIVETNLYTSYNQKVMENGQPTYKTQTKMKGEGTTSFASTTTPSTAYGLRFDRLKQHASYGGTETINGARCHILQVDDPGKVDPEMGSEAEGMTYYIDAEQYVPARMVMQTKASKGDGPEASAVTINLTNYQTTDGLTLPHRMEMEFKMNISEKQRQQMEQMMKQMENMPAQQRKQMERMLGDKMDMMKRMMSGDPVVIEVQSVKVNTEIPSGIF